MELRKEPSDIFSDIFDSCGGGCMRDCDCGRTHFDASGTGGWSWEEGELEGLREKAERDPEHYTAQDCSIGGIQIDGRFFVHNCPCNKAVRYENFIIQHAPQIAKYLNELAKVLAVEAKLLKVNGFEDDCPL